MKKKEIVKRSLLVGVGVAAYAHNKAQKLVGELLRKGHINKSEGKRLVSSVYHEAEVSGKRIAKVMETELKRVAKVASGKKK